MINKKFFLRSSKNIYSRISPKYSKTIRLLNSSEYLSEESLKHWQFTHLKKMLVHAYENSSYYAQSFRQSGVNPNEMQNLEYLLSFPLLTKEQYRANIDSILSKNAIKSSLIRAYTGGTTGNPVPVYRYLGDYPREQAFTDYSYRMLDMEPNSKTVYLRGQVADKKGIYHQIGNLGKTLFLSSHNMTDKSLELYIGYIRNFKPQLLVTIPSVALILAGYMKKNNVPPFRELKWAFCPSETLYDFQINFIQKILQCRVGTFYGHSEHAVMAARCTKSSMYHVLPQYGYTELIDKNGNSVTKAGELGEIVATAFTNSCCPFIRYRTGDYAIYSEKKCSCGRNYKLWEKIKGRNQDVAIGKHNESISMGPDLLCTIFDKTYMKIKQFKIEQFREGELIIKVVPHKDHDFTKIQKYFKRVFNDQYPGVFDIEVIQIADKDFSHRDKHLFYTQHIQNKNTVHELT